MKVIRNARETRKCVARLSRLRANGRPRAPGRCGTAALDFGDVRVAGELVEIPLCRIHFRILRDSADPAEMTRDWAVAQPARPMPPRVLSLALGGTGADDLRVRRKILGVSAERAAAARADLPALGCCARVGAYMPTWAPRRGARCELRPTYFPGFTIRGGNSSCYRFASSTTASSSEATTKPSLRCTGRPERSETRSVIATACMIQLRRLAPGPRSQGRGLETCRHMFSPRFLGGEPVHGC